MTQLFAGKTAIVIGGNRGLGKLCALFLASHGANVVVHGDADQVCPSSTARDTLESELTSSEQKAVDVVVQQITAAGGTAISHISSPDQAGSLVQWTIKNFGRIDILVYNLAIESARSWTQTSQDDWNDLVKTNFKLQYKVGL
jgi:NAD(P)-dependent dehydrogenase (short-subunit alcohol dehydrogenase family)